MCTNDRSESSSARCQSWSKLAPGRYKPVISGELKCGKRLDLGEEKLMESILVVEGERQWRKSQKIGKGNLHSSLQS
ncbi:hypothetical protein MTR_1g073520 [Medicago truncatula]|uniref:Uncharacterized protein n=1 Tax=Medicago truncatula TaxID=3880 RepID=A0A072VX47_MEDTR|nr:hypothetical protein MTR_1g073520 [Medicago truncatula]